MVKKMEKGNQYLTENCLNRNEMRQIIKITCPICAKELLDWNFDQAVIYKISIFNEITPHFTYSQKL